jgi:hypothetical protein
MIETTKALDIDLSLKKNNVDEFFNNLSENPNGFKNKDFRYTLSLIYQLIEDEFEGIFLSPNQPVRNTDFFLINDGNEKERSRRAHGHKKGYRGAPQKGRLTSPLPGHVYHEGRRGKNNLRGEIPVSEG